jgi:aryl-alcohol dehydrogenase-like predicted oxidoreductase
MALCGVTKVKHAKSNVEALNWELTSKERAILDEAAKTLIQQ